ncbi:MAG TPA: hypothetical protein VJB90_04940 [Candidatus Nanoarchaeia archaeon]|nr:hypothetical protein [Candidatus Nanoarchaeia archaeon]
MKKESLYRLFDDCRYKRNSLVYYGSELNLDIAKQSIDTARKLITELNAILKDTLNQK